MYPQLPLWLYPLLGLMALGALGFLGLILWRGDLCPGQRARIMGQLFSLWSIVALSVLLALGDNASPILLACGGLAAGVGMGLSIWQSKQAHKHSIPARWLWLAALPLLAYGVQLIDLLGALNGIAELILLGSVSAHLFLLRARHRLQAFNLLLPIGGILGALLALVAFVITLGSSALITPELSAVVAYLLLLLFGLGIWLYPLLRATENAPQVVAVALIILLAAQTIATGIVA